ncbi:Uncharacterised protein [Mycobacterium tuberculosis]|nr:Uncharacterised protein [Mycobacterium tuberculosis]
MLNQYQRIFFFLPPLYQCAEDNFDITDRDLLSDKPLKDIRNTLNR